MRHRTTIAVFGGAIALSALTALGGGIEAGAATVYGSSTTSPSPSTTVSTQPAAAQAAHKSATLHTARAVVGGKSETILVTAGDVPLYYYRLDTPKKSFVTGALAKFWPPLVSASHPSATGVQGTLTVSKEPEGHQVAYNGHFLYTFAEDSPGHVTGQGVEDFFVATPRLKKAIVSASTAKVAPATSGGGYGY